MRGWFDVDAPAKACEVRKRPAVRCREAVDALTDARKRWRMLVPIQQPVFVWMMSQSAEGSFGAAVNRTVGFDKVNRLFEFCSWQFGKLGCHVWRLEPYVINEVLGGELPAMNPEPTEVAIAVENHEWLVRRTGDLERGLHRQ